MTLEVEIHAREMQVDDRLDEYVTKKVVKLDRYLNNIQEARVDLGYTKTARNANDRFVAQITVRGKGLMLRSEERTDDVYSAFDAALDKMQRRMSRYKGKRYRDRGDGTSVADTAMQALDLEEYEEEPEAPVIKRRKKFMLIPMDENEAIEQMELLGHEDFFIFYNPISESVSVLYRRRDDSLGLIETEIA